jgi:hypothetical protein
MLRTQTRNLLHSTPWPIFQLGPRRAIRTGLCKKGRHQITNTIAAVGAVAVAVATHQVVQAESAYADQVQLNSNATVTRQGRCETAGELDCLVWGSNQYVSSLTFKLSLCIPYTGTHSLPLIHHPKRKSNRLSHLLACFLLPSETWPFVSTTACVSMHGVTCTNGAIVGTPRHR